MGRKQKRAEEEEGEEETVTGYVKAVGRERKMEDDLRDDQMTIDAVEMDAVGMDDGKDCARWTLRR